MTEKRTLGEQNIGKLPGPTGAEQKQLLANNPYQSAENMQIVRSQEQNNCKPGTLHDVHLDSGKDKPALTQVKEQLQKLLPAEGNYHVIFSSTKEGTGFTVKGPSTEANRRLAESIGKVKSNDFWLNAAELVRNGQGDLALGKQAAGSPAQGADSFKPTKDSSLQTQPRETATDRPPAQPSSSDRAQETQPSKDSLLRDLQAAIPAGVDVSFSLQRDPTHKLADQIRYQPSKNLTPEQWKGLGDAVNNALQNPELAQYLSHGTHLESGNHALVAETPAMAKSEASPQTTDSRSAADAAGYNKQDSRFELGASAAYLRAHPELAAKIQQEQAPTYPEAKMVGNVSDYRQEFLQGTKIVNINGHSAEVSITETCHIPANAGEGFKIGADLAQGLSGALRHVDGFLHIDAQNHKWFCIQKATIDTGNGNTQQLDAGDRRYYETIRLQGPGER